MGTVEPAWEHSRSCSCPHATSQGSLRLRALGSISLTGRPKAEWRRPKAEWRTAKASAGGLRSRAQRATGPSSKNCKGASRATAAAGCEGALCAQPLSTGEGISHSLGAWEGETKREKSSRPRSREDGDCKGVPHYFEAISLLG